jgi:hypothetical protein
VPHRPDPKRINEARRAAIRNVLIDEDRMSPDLADAWIAAWEADAAALPIEPGSDYWTLGLEWIHRQSRRKP